MDTNSQFESATSNVLTERKKAGKGSLIGYFPAGYPSLDESIEAAIAMCKSGIDVLELGVPYSDPVMDGLVIQQATEVALSNGFKLSQVFQAVEAITAAVDTPVLVMTYWNPVLSYGVDAFAKELSEAGGAGLITPDLIPDEAAEWLAASDKYKLDRVFLTAPTSTPERVKNSCELSRGFVYAVSTMGITGTRDSVDELAKQVVSSVRAASQSQNTAVGIGISSAQQVLDVNSYADGAIVGSAFVRAYADGGLAALQAKVQELSEALN
jgi:tryptophan synthase alpha chain